MDLLSFVPLFTALTVLFLFAYVFGQGQRTRVSRTFLAFLFLTFLVCLLEFLIRSGLPLSLRMAMARLGMAVFLLLGPGFARFAYAVTNRRDDRWLALLFLLALVSIVVSLRVEHHAVVAALGRALVVPTPSYVLLFASLLMSVVLSGRVLVEGYRGETRPVRRRQIALVLWAQAGSTTFAVVLLVIAPLLLELYTVYRFTSLGALLHVAFLYRAVLRYRLASIDTREIEEVSRVLFRNVDEAVVVADAAGGVMELNERAQHLFPGVAIGDSLRGLEERLQGYRCDSDINGRVATLTVGDSRRCCVVSQHAMAGEEGLLGRILIVRDVTDMRRAEEEIARKNRMESLGLLAGGVAHDFNNQLAGMMGCAEMLRGDLSLDESRRELADMIVKAAHRSSVLTNQLLAFARKGKFQSVTVNLHTVVAEVVSMLERSIDKKIAIRQRLDARTPAIVGDPSQLHHALLNVALNSRDAMPEGGTITFASRTIPPDIPRAWRQGLELAPGEHVEITIADTGHGMPEEVRERVFEPFYTTKEKGKGSGMGMAAVYGIVRNHGGSIALDSTEGEGTVVALAFPAVEAEAGAVAEARETPTAAGARGEIMVVDDEQVVCMAVSKMLEQEGFRVSTCRNGREAIEHYRRHWREVGLVLLDLIMPELDGKATYRSLKEINPEVAVLLCSGYSLDGDAQALLDSGADGFIQKPFRRPELIEEISRLRPPA